MKVGDANRLSVLKDLLALSAPVQEVADSLSKLGVDYDGIGVELTASHVSQVLRRYVEGELSESTVEAWANMIEGRDDVRIADAVEPVMHELANPYLTYPLDADRAGHLLSLLGLACGVLW